MKRSLTVLVAPWVPPARANHRVTVPPPPGGEVGGLPGVSTGYCHRMASTPYWKRMALSDYALRMKENATRYPMSATQPGEYSLQYTVSPYPDPLTHRPLLEVGEPRRIPMVQIPVIFLTNVYDDEAQRWVGKKHETVYVPRALARESLLPQRLAVYATPTAYQLLGLPVKHHAIHDEIPKTPEQYRKVLARQHYEEERWQYSIEMLFRQYADGPALWKDGSAATGVSQEGEEARWACGGEEEAQWLSDSGRGVGSGEGGAEGSAAATTRTGPKRHRKARKIALF